MITFETVEDFQSQIGNELGVGEWIEIPQKKINEFAALTEDEQWIHVDAERASKSPLGSTIAHGYFILSLVAPAVMSLTMIDNARQYLNYGMNRVRFLAPVLSGSWVRTRLQLKSVEGANEGFLFTVEATVEVFQQEKPACVAEIVTYVEF